MAINGTSKGYLGSSGAPSINTVEWASLQQAFGQEYFVSDNNAARVTVVSGTTVRVAAGASVANPQVIGGRGVVDTFTAPHDLTLTPPSSDGTVHHLVCTRRTWQATQASSVTSVAGSATRAIPSGRNKSPGTLDDQPLGLVAVTKAGSTVTATVVDDLRAIGYGSGSYLINSTMVMDYLSKPGYRFRMPDGTEWLIALDGSRVQTATPLELATSFPAENGEGWTAAGTQFPSQLTRNLRHRKLDLELRRVSGGPISPSPNGQINNVLVYRLTSATDFPSRMAQLNGTYLGTNAGDATASGYIDTAGRIYLTALSPNVELGGAVTGSWSLRLSGDWYTA